MLCGCFEIDVVVAGAGAYYHLQLRSCIHDVVVYLVAADNQSVGVPDGFQQVGACASLNHFQLVA